MSDPKLPVDLLNTTDGEPFESSPATHTFDGSHTLAEADALTGTAATFDPEPDATGPTLAVHQTLGRYKVLELLGSGGMGEVWRVWDPSLRREVALKVMRHGRSLATRRLGRFVAEAQATAQLQHPGVVPVYDHGQLPDGRAYYTMKVIEGRTLADLVPGLQAKSTPEYWGQTTDGLTVIDLVSALHDVSEALAYAHERGVIHRDIKPANILIGHYGEVLLVDWGLVKIISESIEPTDHGMVQTDQSLQPELATRFGAVAGTLGFMPPEQADGRTDLLDERSDVYALGAVLWYILTGRVPRRLDRIVDALDELPRVDPVLRSICLSALSTNREDRPANAGKMAEQLNGWLRGARAEAQAAASAQRAELAVLALPLEAQRRVRIWCLRIVDPDGQVSPVPLPAKLEPDLEHLLDGVLFARDERGVSFADPSLPEVWSRLQGWMLDHADQHRQLHAVTSAARDWSRAQRSPRMLWTDSDGVHRGRPVAALLGAQEQAFIAACDTYLTRRRRKRRSLTAAIITVLLGSTALSATQWLDAVDARNDESQARIEAEARSFHQQAHRHLAEHDPHAAVAYFQAADHAFAGTAGRDAERTVAALNPVRIYAKHTNDTRATAWAPDSQLVATGSNDTTVQLWNPRTGETVHTLAHDSGVRKVVWSPDGLYVATCTLEGEVRIWEVSSGDLLHSLPDDNPWVTALRFVRDGRLLSGDIHGELRLYDPKSGAVTETLSGHTHYVFASDETPDGRWLATASVDETVRVWNLEDGTLHRTFDHPAQLLHVAITPDGRHVVAGGTDDPRVWLWDVDTGRLIAVLESGVGAITGVDASTDGQTIATMGNDRAVHFWSAETGALLHESQRFDGDEVTGGGFSPDGSLFAVSTSVEGVVYIDPRTGSIIGRETRSGTSSRSFLWSPDGAANLVAHPDGSASVHTLAHRPTKETEPCGTGGLVDARFSSDNRWLAVMPPQGGFCVASLETGNILAVHEGNIGNGRWGPSGRRLTFWHTAAQSAHVQVWDRITGAIRTYMPGEPTSSEAWISPDGQMLYSASRNNSLMKVSLDTGELIERIPLPGRPLTTIFVGDQVLVLYHDRTADIWDIAKGQKLARHDRSDLNPLARALDPNGAFVIWETTSGVLEKVVFDGSDGWTVDIPSEPQNIKLSRSGRWVVTLDGEQVARVYATRTGVLVMEESFEGNAPAVDFSSSGDRMLLLTDRGEVRVYRLRDGAILSVLQLERGAEIVRARFDNDQSIITVSKDLVARTWSVPHDPPDPGTISNLRPCADGRLVPVTPWPDADVIWAPQAQCASPTIVSQNGPASPQRAQSAVD